MPKVAPIEDPQDQGGECYYFECPGCHCLHWFRVAGGLPCWTWNGSYDAPTVRASILVQGHQKTTDPVHAICHSFITDGKIQYLGDCTHSLAGQTVELPDIEE